MAELDDQPEDSNPKTTASVALGQSISKRAAQLENTPSEIRGNFFKVVAMQVTMRTAWIFKTESIVMPAVMDLIAGQGWLRGLLPVLNRFGQSIPPLLAAGTVTRYPLKKHLLFTATMVMGICFLSLAYLFYIVGASKPGWLPAAFLVVYGVFFVAVGIYNLVLSTLIGKVIQTQRRGRLMFFANIGGASCAVLCAWFLLREWISPQAGSFTNIFAFAGCGFILAGSFVLLLVEKRDEFAKEAFSPKQIFAEAIKILKTDRNFRQLAIIGSLFGLSLTLFPHYQRLGKDRFELGLDALIPWLISQNLGVAFFSYPAGKLADRFGNRLVLRIVLVGLTIAPLIAILMSYAGPQFGNYFFVVFVLLGLTPVSFRVFSNYALEMAARELQPRYLSTLSLCIALPTMILSPIVGLVVDQFDFEPAFAFVVICLVIAWLLTLSLREPRISDDSV